MSVVIIVFNVSISVGNMCLFVFMNKIILRTYYKDKLASGNFAVINANYFHYMCEEIFLRCNN